MTQWPRDTIDDKQKTGDIEQLGLIWAAHQSVTQESPSTWIGAKEDRKEFATQYLGKVGTQLSKSTFWGAIAKASEFNYERVGGVISEAPALEEVRQTLKAVYTEVKAPYKQFIVNLAMVDFRTAGGGRARKSTTVLRKGADDFYARPFEAGFSYYVSFLISVVPDRPLDVVDPPEPVVITLDPESVYVPPTRFTATFPLALGGEKHDTKKTFFAPKMPDKEPTHDKSTIKYGFLGSFGFAEPGYCEWEKTKDTETAGTRLSPGAYALHPVYLEHLSALMGAMDEETAAIYAKYGSVGRAHVDRLVDKLGSLKGFRLAVVWVAQMVDIAAVLVAAAEVKAQTHAPKLCGFFAFIQGKIAKRREKLKTIAEDTTGKHNLFEYLWVFESTLWEYAFLGASSLSTYEIRAALGEIFTKWQPSIGVSRDADADYSVVDELLVDKRELRRVYLPSGTAAAKALYEVLLEHDHAPLALTSDVKELTTFTPYFEFYQYEHSFLNTNEVSKLPSKPNVQLWVNLSDGLHAELMNLKVKDAGEKLAKKMAEHVLKRVPSDPVCLVIDFTKITGDMPNSTLYPILLELTAGLLGHLEGKVTGIFFVRSNLKYNTGSLDRYQSGEILMPAGPLAGEISGALVDRAVVAFTGEDADEALFKDWKLRGEYVPLMRKLYLLSDAVTTAHWAEYCAL